MLTVLRQFQSWHIDGWRLDADLDGNVSKSEVCTLSGRAEVRRFMRSASCQCPCILNCTVSFRRLFNFFWRVQAMSAVARHLWLVSERNLRNIRATSGTRASTAIKPSLEVALTTSVVVKRPVTIGLVMFKKFKSINRMSFKSQINGFRLIKESS